MEICPFEKIEKEIKENKFSHAYLIETNNIERCKKELIFSLKKIIFEQVSPEDYKIISNQIEKNVFPEIITIEPEENIIKKEQSMYLQEQFLNKPIYSKQKKYIIIKPEKLNQSAANSLLKFLEEPEEQIVGFLITANQHGVISTIKSRCTLLRKYYDNESLEDEFDVDNEQLTKIYLAIKLILSNLDQGNVAELFLKRKEVLEKISTREDFSTMLRIINKIYYKKLMNVKNSGTNNEVDKFVPLLKEQNKKSILNKMIIIEEIIKNSGYNINIDLSFDQLFIEMGKVNE